MRLRISAAALIVIGMASACLSVGWAQEQASGEFKGGIGFVQSDFDLVPTLVFTNSGYNVRVVVRSTQRSGEESESTKQYRIAESALVVQLKRLPASLRSQLKVAEGRGLVVTGFGDATLIGQVRLQSSGIGEGGAFIVGEANPLEGVLRTHDILLSADEQPLKQVRDLLEALLKAGRKKSIVVELLRDGDVETVTVRSEDLVVPAHQSAVFDPVAQAEEQFMIGVTLDDVDELTRSLLNIPKRQGVLVTGVLEGSAAEKADLQKYDILLSVDEQPLDNTNKLSEELEESEGRPVALRIIRQAQQRTVNVSPEAQKLYDVVSVNISKDTAMLSGNAGVLGAEGSGFFHLARPQIVATDAVPHQDSAPLETQINELRDLVKSLKRSIDRLDKELNARSDSAGEQK